MAQPDQQPPKRSAVSAAVSVPTFTGKKGAERAGGTVFAGRGKRPSVPSEDEEEEDEEEAAGAAAGWRPRAPAGGATQPLAKAKAARGERARRPSPPPPRGRSGRGVRAPSHELDSASGDESD